MYKDLQTALQRDNEKRLVYEYPENDLEETKVIPQVTKEIKQVIDKPTAKQKEILFMKEDIKNIQNEKIDYTRLIKYYKRKLVDYGVMKEIRDCQTKKGKYIKKKISTRMQEYASA